jgi:hypothetical protein
MLPILRVFLFGHHREKLRPASIGVSRAAVVYDAFPGRPRRMAVFKTSSADFVIGCSLCDEWQLGHIPRIVGNRLQLFRVTSCARVAPQRLSQNRNPPAPEGRFGVRKLACALECKPSSAKGVSKESVLKLSSGPCRPADNKAYPNWKFKFISVQPQSGDR